MITCTRCSVRKAGQHFPLVNGTRSDVCKKCTAADEGAAAQAANGHTASAQRLVMLPGHGLEAWVEDGALQLVQGEDNVALSRTEAKVLFAEFAEWAA